MGNTRSEVLDVGPIASHLHGHFGKQSQGAVLLRHQAFQEAAGVETESWERFAGVIGRVLSQEGQG